jgi:SepF-like predicted cell division protein (DUF552 family)
MKIQGWNNLARFGLFRRKKEEPQPEEQKPAAEQPVPEEKPAAEEHAAPEPVAEEKPIVEEPPEPAPAPPAEEPETYLKAMPLRELTDLEAVQNEVRNGNIVILKITPLANKNLDDVKKAVDELYTFASSVHGDIARLGEERIVITPEKIRIWREKTPAQDTPSMLPTAA